MSEANGQIPVKLPNVDGKASSEQNGHGRVTTVKTHTDPNLCNQLASSGVCKPHHSSHDILDGGGEPGNDQPPTTFSNGLGVEHGIQKVNCMSDTNDDSEDERPGSFDYMPSQKEHLRIPYSSRPSYDVELGSNLIRGDPPSDSFHRDCLIECNVVEDADSAKRHEISSIYIKNVHNRGHTPGSKHSSFEDADNQNDDVHSRSASQVISSPLQSFWKSHHNQVDDAIGFDIKSAGGTGSWQSHQSISPIFYNKCKELCVLEGSHSKGKKKTKGTDDGDKAEASSQVDVNGNPKPPDPANYLQMRHLSGGKSESTASKSLARSHPPNSSPQPRSSSGSDLDRRKERRRMKLEKQKGTPAEEYEGYRKFKDIKEILDFVEGSKKANRDSKPSKKKPDRCRKKDQLLDGSLTLEDSAGDDDAHSTEESAPMIADDASLRVEESAHVAADDGHRTDESVVITANVKLWPVAMGNSFGRSSTENTSKTGTAKECFDKSNSSEFHDCLSCFPADVGNLDVDLSFATRDQQKPGRKDDNSIYKIDFSSEEMNISNNFPTENNAGKLLPVFPVENNRGNHFTDNFPVGNNSGKHLADNFPVGNNSGKHLPGPLPSEAYTERHPPGNIKNANKRSVKNKSRKGKHEDMVSNGPLSPKTNMVNRSENLYAEDSLTSPVAVNLSNTSPQCSVDKEPLPSFKREDSFTEVKKKKKRQVGKDSYNACISHSFVHNTQYSVHSQNSRTLYQPTPLPPVLPSATSGIFSINKCPPIGPQHFPRDLSPSAFPVLSGHNSLAHEKEARRNSCGDIDSDFVDGRIYDSDRESAKSLPDGRRARDLSPVYPMSYARMAAAPRRNEFTSSPGGDSDFLCQFKNSEELSPTHPSPSTMSERRATVWKGSPRERRHSTGSGPEDKGDGEKSTAAQWSRQCGSQEMLAREAISVINLHHSKDSAASLPSTPPKTLLTTEISSSLQFEAILQNEVSETHTSTGLKQKNDFSCTVQAAASSTSQKCGQKFPPANVPSTDSAVVNTRSLFESGVTGQPLHSEISHKQSQTSHSVSRPISQEFKSSRMKQGTVPKAATGPMTSIDASCNALPACIKAKPSPVLHTALRSTGTKSVIFLDKHYNLSPPHNLGITFGFDASYEPPTRSVSPWSQPAAASPVISSSQCRSENPQTPTSPAISQGHSGIPSAAPTSAAHPYFFTTLPSQLRNSNKPIPKGPSIQGPCNGLILPSSTAGKSAIPQDLIFVNSMSNFNNGKQNTSLGLTNHAGGESGIHGPGLADNTGAVPQSVFSSSSEEILSSNSAVSITRPQHSVGVGDDSVKVNQSHDKVEVNQSNCNVNVNKCDDSVKVNKPHDGVKVNLCDSGVKINHSDGSVKVNLSDNRVKVNQPDNSVNPTNPKEGASSCIQGPVLPTQITDGESRNIGTAFCLTPSLPSTPSKTELTPERKSGLGSVKSTVPTCAANPASIVREVQTLVLATSSLAETAAASQQQPTARLDKPPPGKLIVYGLKVKPRMGCGQLLFIPSSITRMDRQNMAEVCQFLRKRWLESDSQRNGSGTVFTLVED